MRRRAVGAMTAAYATAMAISATAPTVAGVWMADAFGWRLSLATWALVSFVGAIPWLIVIPFAKRRGIAEAELNATLPIPLTAVSLSRSPTALAVMVIFAIAGATAYTAFSLLPLMLSDIAGVGRTEAALALGLFSIVGLPLSLLIPPLAVRRGSAGILVGVATLTGVLGWLGLLLFPGAWLYVWVTLLAISPLSFHLSLTLIGQAHKESFLGLAAQWLREPCGLFLCCYWATTRWPWLPAHRRLGNQHYCLGGVECVADSGCVGVAPRAPC